MAARFSVLSQGTVLTVRKSNQITVGRGLLPPQTSNPEGNLPLGKEAELPTVGNAVLSVPKKRTVGDDGPYRKHHFR